MSRYSTVVLGGMISFIGGVLVQSFVSVSSYVMYGVVGVVIGTLVFRYRDKTAWMLFFCGIGSVAGILRISSVQATLVQQIPSSYSGQVLIERVERHPNGMIEVIAAPLTIEPTSSKVASDKMLIKSRQFFNASIGSVLSVSCQLKSPGQVYSYPHSVERMAIKKIRSICSQPKMEMSQNPDEIISRLHWIVRARISSFAAIEHIVQNGEQVIMHVFPYPTSGYLAGLLLGGDDRLPRDIAEDFRRTGTTHTVAVSGYNITIIANMLMLIAIGAGMWRQHAFWVAVSGVVVFVLMVGAPASAVRAAIMGILLLWAAKNGRLSESYRGWVFAAMVMTAFQPLLLRYDVGFQLSFLATAGIIFLYGALSNSSDASDIFQLRSTLIVTICAQIGVLGILLGTFQGISLVSLLANLIILPFIPFIMAGGFIVMSVGMISPPIATVLGIPVWLLLRFELWIVRVLAKFPSAYIQVVGLGWWWMIGYYGWLFMLIRSLRRKRFEDLARSNNNGTKVSEALSI